MGSKSLAALAAILVLQIVSADQIIYAETSLEPRAGLWQGCLPAWSVNQNCEVQSAVIMRPYATSCVSSLSNLIAPSEIMNFNLNAERITSGGTLHLAWLATGPYGSGGIRVRVNGCEGYINAYDASCGARSGTLSFAGTCFNTGANTLTISPEGGQQIIPLGSGACPSSSCGGAVYAGLDLGYLARATTQKYAERNYAVRENKTVWNATLSCSRDNGTLEIEIPNDANGARISGASGEFECGTSQECARSGNKITIPNCAAGAYSLAYAVPAIELGALLLENYANSAYFAGESATIKINTTLNGAPVAGLAVRASDALECITDSSGSCALVFPISNELGEKNIFLRALDSNSHAGETAIKINIESNVPELSVSESLQGNTLVASLKIKNSASREIKTRANYTLPPDYTGNLSVVHEDGAQVTFSVENGIVFFDENISGKGERALRVMFEINGTMIFHFGEPSVAAGEIVVGDALVAGASANITNTNDFRALHAQIASNAISGWNNAEQAIQLSPGEHRQLSLELRRAGPTECSYANCREGNSYSYRACIHIPEDEFIPNMKIIYKIPAARLQDWGARASSSPRALADNSDADVQVFDGGDFATIVVGTSHTYSSLHEGDHYILLQYNAQPAVQQPAQQQQLPSYQPEIPIIQQQGNENTQQPPTETQQNTNTEQQPARERLISIIVDDAVSLGANVNILILENGKLANGEMRATPPSQKGFYFAVVDGKTSFVPDEEGRWTLDYGGSKKEISVVPETGTPTTNAASQTDAPTQQETKSRASPNEPQPTTGMLLSNIWIPVVFVLALAALAVFYALNKQLSKPRIKITKTYARGIVKIEVKNDGGELSNVRITDFAPEDARLTRTKGASVKDTIFGLVISWQRPELGSGETWSVSYGMKTRMKKLKQAEVSARTKDGEEITLSSIT